MRSPSLLAIDQDEVVSPHYLPADVREKFAFAERRRRRNFWFWTLIVSTMLGTIGVTIWVHLAVSKGLY